MALLLPILNEHQHYVTNFLGDEDLPRLKLTDEDFLSPLLPKSVRKQMRLKLSDEDFLSPLLPRRVRRQALHPYNRSLKKSVSKDNSFSVNIDVQQFTPEEISIKSINNDTILVECKHEEKADEHGSIFRHFVRKYKVPKGHDISKCFSKLSNDGVLTISVPVVEKRGKTEIEIPITFTNLPHVPSESNDVLENDDK